MNRFLANRRSDFEEPRESGTRFSKRIDVMRDLEEMLGPAAASTRFAKVNRDLWGSDAPSQGKKRSFNNSKGGA